MRASKPAVSIISLLLIATTASSAASSGPQDTGSQHAAPAVRVREVVFSGNPAFAPDVLTNVLEALEIRHVIPGIWTRRPRYDTRAVDSDLIRLRSFYFSHGYFDARVSVGSVTVDGREATVTLDIQPGLKYGSRNVEIEGIGGEGRTTAITAGRDFPGDSLCRCLLEARRNAESQGRLDFSVELELSDADESASADTDTKWIDATARMGTGPAYTLGRINFSGHHKINESTLRRELALQERSLLDVGKLRHGLARLNRSGFFEPLTLDDVVIQRNSETLTADLTIPVRERPGGRWSLSGPLGLTRLLGSLEASISLRLPAWGRGLFEASTYYLTFSVIGFPTPLLRLLPIPGAPTTRSLLILERPYLPGQALYSGFALSPQLSPRQLLASYGLTHLAHLVHGILTPETPDAPGLLVPISGPQRSAAGAESEPRLLICDRSAPRHRWLRRAALLAADLAISAFRPF